MVQQEPGNSRVQNLSVVVPYNKLSAYLLLMDVFARLDKRDSLLEVRALFLHLLLMCD